MEQITRSRGGENESRECPICHSKKNWKDGLTETNVQRFICRDCGYRFTLKSYKDSQTNGDCQLCDVLQDAKKLDTKAMVEQTIAGEKTETDGRIIEYRWKETKRGIKKETIDRRVIRLNKLKRLGAEIDNPESVLAVMMTEKFNDSQKFHYVNDYASYTKAFKIPFEKPHLSYEPKAQYTPKPYEVTVLVQNLGREQSALVQTMAETGARVGEMSRLLWSEIDVQGQIIYINHPEKNSKARKIHVSQQAVAKLQKLRKNHGSNVFNPNKRTLQSTYARSRNRIADKLDLQNLKRIHHHSFRRYYADQIYKKTRFNTRKVQARLGHKHLLSTEKYFGDFDDENCTYETARAYSIEDEETLRQQGYDLYSTSTDENGKTVKLYSRLT